LEEALELLDSNGNGFLAIVDSETKLIGIITDGDIRRAVLNKNFELATIINRSPSVASINDTHVKIKQELRRIHRRHMPVVDQEGRLVEVIILDNFETVPKENWVVIMAGGMGTRLGELTKDTPKPMLRVGEKPILLNIVESFKACGFYRFVFCVNYKSHIIEEYFGDGSKFDIEIVFTHENKRMGTAGALSLIDFDLRHPFFVVNGDVLTSINFDDFLNFHVVGNSKATMCVKKFSFELPYATIDFDEKDILTNIKEKPAFDYHVNTGMYILDPSVVSMIPKNEYYDMPTLFEELISRQLTTKVFKIDEYWVDIGKPGDFNQANRDHKAF